jgi:hypothetical protein
VNEKVAVPTLILISYIVGSGNVERATLETDLQVLSKSGKGIYSVE